jgi:hypothetical protein
MSGKSVTLTFGSPEPEPAPAPAPSAPAANPALMTRDERTSANWQTLFVGWVVGFPSLLAIAFVVIVDLHYSWLYTDDTRSWLLLSAGLVTVTLFSAGLPIAAGLTHETSPIAARAAGIFWLVCVAANLGIMGYFTMTSPAPAPVSVQQVQSEEARQKIAEIADRRADIADAEAHQDRWHEETRVWYANAKKQLAHLERAYGVPSSISAAPATGHGLDMAAIALLMIVGSAIGLAISASSLAAILTEKAATVRLEAPAMAAPAPTTALASYHPGESADGFDHWAKTCISKLDGKRIRPAEAHASYQNFCGWNDYAQPLPIQEFGRRLRGWIMSTFNIDGHHVGSQGGTVYDGVTLAPLAQALAAPSAHGGA